jgi:indole-3-glycerol phosphate synthase
VADILRSIYASKAERRARAEATESHDVLRERAMKRRSERRPFLETLRRAGGSALIAEIKRASPSAGLIARSFDPAAIADAYERAGVDAISVLTEEDHFLGDLAYLDIVRVRTERPILRKDFLSTPYEVAQSAAYGADCILLIVAGLDDQALRSCIDEAAVYDMDVLVEVHDAVEMRRAIDLGARLIGINNRNLRTFETNLAVSEHLLPSVPDGVFAISESGMRDAGDIERLRAAGARGFLIGEALMRAQDPASLVASLKHLAGAAG